MNWRTTGLLLVLAGVLFAFIFVVERHTRPTSALGQPAPALLSFRPEDINAVQLRRTNQLVLRAERTNEGWTLTVPLSYPAQRVAIEQLLKELSDLHRQAFIAPDELAGRTLTDYGLAVPVATLSLHRGETRSELRFGNKTPAGDQVYVQLLNSPGIQVLAGELFDRLPRTANDWRDRALLSLTGLNVDRFEVRAASRGFAIQVDPTNKVYYLSKPTPARADAPKVVELIRRLGAERVLEFISDNPRVELDPFGLQPPEAEVAFGQGTNDLVMIQFGKSPTNQPTAIYARRLAQTNVVLVSKALLEVLQTSHTGLRDRHLFTFAPEAIDTIEVIGPEGFVLRRQTNGLWSVPGPPAQMADPDLVKSWLGLMARLEGEVEKDVVTDFAIFGLAQPIRQYVLRHTFTNAAGTVTNRIVSQLDVGGGEQDKVFVRRPDENSVYALKTADLESMPVAAWQLRDRRVWSFTTNQILRVTIQQRGQTRQLLRNAAGDWSLAPGSQGAINTFAVEETMHRLGQLRAVFWVAQGHENRVLYGFTDTSYKLTIELKNGEKPQSLTLEFGGRAPSQFPYALASVDGRSMIFEFPVPLFYEVLRDLGIPTPPTAAAFEK